MKRGTPKSGSFEARREAGSHASRRSYRLNVLVFALLAWTAAGCGTKSGEWLGLSGEKALFDLQQSDEGLAITTSSNPAAKLGFVCLPKDINAGSEFSWTTCSSIQVQILDSRGARVVGASSGGNDSALTVSLSVASGTGTLSIQEGASDYTVSAGAVSTAASSGLASFDTAGLSMTSAGLKIIRATVTTSGGKTLSISTPRFTVLPKDEIASLVYVTQPQSSYVSGIGWTKLPAVEIRDEYGNRITTGSKSTASATFEIVDQPGILRGTTTASARAGVITPRANSLNVLALGSDYSLRTSVTSNGQTFTADSSTFSIVHGPAAQLVFTQQPVGDTADGQLLTKPIVEIRDRFGNRVTSGTDATAAVVLKAAARSGTLVGTNVVSGSITLSAVAGVANFSSQSLAIRESGTNKRVESSARLFGSASTQSLRSVQSSGFSVAVGDASPLTSTLTVSSNARARADGTSFVTATLIVRDAWGNLISGYPGSGSVQFAASGTGNAWTQPTGTTDSRGRIAGQLRATFFGSRTITVASPSALASVGSVETSFQSTQPAPTNLSYSQMSPNYLLNQAITSNNPSSSGGTVASYSISSALPSGLSFNTSTGRITGTPTALLSATPFTVTANNSGGSTSATLTISVIQGPPTVAYSPSSYTMTKGTSYTLTATSTNAESFSVGGSLPAGLSLDSATGTISGTPSAVAAAAAYTVTVSDGSGQTGSATISITVRDVAPASLVYSSPNSSYTVSVAITPNTPSNSGGDVVSYSITPALPAGLSLDGSTGVLSGTPTAVRSPAGVYTVTATNTGGSTSATVTISVASATPTISFTGSPFTWTIGTAYTLTPTTTNAQSFTISRALPSGLSLNTSTGVVSGTPTAVSSASSYTVTVTSVSGQTAAATINLTVKDIAPSGLVYSSPSATYTVGAAITNNSPSSSGGTVVSYSITPSIAAQTGLSFSTSTGVVSGTPTTTKNPGGVYTVTATNTGGSTTSTVTITVTITVNAAAPTISYAGSPFTLVKGTGYTLSATSTNASSFAIGGSLPTGLSFNTSTGAITGTPSAASVATPYSVTVTNSTGQTATATINLAVNDSAPSNLAYSSPSATYAVGTAITSNSPTSSGGAIVSYAISPNLNSQTGLSFSTSTGVISGTPTTTKNPAGVYTVTATNSGGSTTATVTITVNAATPTISYAGAPFTLTKGTAYTLSATTTNAASVSISRSLPMNLGFSTATGNITGTPSNLSAASSYTVTATNSTGQTASVTISLAVNDIPPTNLSYPSKSPVYTMNLAINNNTPSVSGGPVTSYSVTPGLPAGLNIHPSSGMISGTPTATKNPAGVYTVSASNSGGSASANLTITVNAPNPVFNYYSWYSNLVINTSVTLTTYGSNVASVSVTPALPAGLSLNPTTGVVTGAPTALKSGTYYTAYAYNSTGQSTSAPLYIAVVIPPPSNLVYSSSSATYTMGSTIPQLTVSSVSGTVTSYWTSGLPAGLWINSSTGVISGVPSGAFNGTVTVLAGNSTGSTAAYISMNILKIGCMDSSAMNYDSAAAVSDNSCIYGVGKLPMVAVGENSTCMISRKGHLSCFGNISGDFGMGYKQVAVSDHHACAITVAGALQCWGYNNWGELVSDSSVEYSTVSVSPYETCAVTVSGDLNCWGHNPWGQVVSISEGGFSKVSAGLFHTCALDSSGTISCYGANTYGQNISGSGYASVSAGAYHTCGITSGSYLQCSGTSSYGETGLSGWNYAQVSTNLYVTCAIDTSGNLSCVGNNAEFQLGSGSGYTQVATSPNHTCALRTDDSMDCWGAYQNGQLGSYDRNRYGCTDSNAENYSSTAQINDGSCTYPPVYGCTNSSASNYDPSANTDNGTCIIYGCMDSSAGNYNSSANYSDSSCVYYTYGCTDSSATNYNSAANYNDGSCTYPPPVYGCTNSSANNYNSSANSDDGSCTYTVYGCTNQAATNYNSSANADDGSCTYPAYTYGCTNPSATNYNGSANSDDGSCTYPTYGCTNPSASNYSASATVDDGSCTNTVYGCTDTTANNYNSNANTNDGSCTYTILGCTDSAATNYNPNANTNDGSCSFYYYANTTVSGCTNSSAANYNPSANQDDGSCYYYNYGCTDSSATNYDPYANMSNGSCTYNTPSDCGDADGNGYDDCTGNYLW